MKYTVYPPQEIDKAITAKAAIAHLGDHFQRSLMRIIFQVGRQQTTTLSETIELQIFWYILELRRV